ncbi:hypothetical protein BC826DRAFT_1061285, partial [Russula brevipes]
MEELESLFVWVRSSHSKWALHQFNIISLDDDSDTERWTDSCRSRRHPLDSFRATFAAFTLPGVTISDCSDKDLLVLINYKSKATAAIRQQHKSLALSYLRSRKQLEDVLAQRLGSLNILQSTLLRVEGAAEDIQVTPLSLTCSTATLHALLAQPSIQCDAMERTFDALVDSNADAREVDEAVRSGEDVVLDEIKGELATLEAEAKTEARTKEKMQEPVELEVTSWDGVSEIAQHARPRTSADPPDL